MNAIIEKGKWSVEWIIEKFKSDQDVKNNTPYAREVFKENLLVNAGIQLMEDLLIGSGSPTVFNNTNAHIGVGDDNTAADASQTDLQAVTNKLRKGMIDGSFPSRSNQTISFKSEFGSSEANFAWEEFAVFNASSAGTMLNRKVESKGTKSNGETWTVQINITIS